MGYTTDFSGQFDLNKELDEATYALLVGLAGTCRMARNLPPEYGVEGEFYVDGSDECYGQNVDKDVIDANRPPSTQPGQWLQWAPTDDSRGIAFKFGEEKDYGCQEEWLSYLIDKILAPKGYILNGVVAFIGEHFEDVGNIVVKDNVVSVNFVDLFKFHLDK